MLERFLAAAPRARLVAERGGTLDMLLFGGHAESLVRLLAVPVKPVPGRGPSVETARIEDALSLGLAFPQFRAIAGRRVQEHLRLMCGPWAGQEIVCVGEKTEANDFPPALVADQGLLRTLCRRTLLSGREPPPGREPPNLFNAVRRAPATVTREPCVMYEVGRLRAYLVARQWCTSADFNSLGLHFRSRREFYPVDEPWILRNLTTKEFVRAEAVALRPQFVHGPDIDVVGFGQVLVSRICWSSAPAAGFQDPTNVSRGVWAGHRFDITTLARHRRETRDRPAWDDVSDEVMEDIATIWECNYGAGWRDFLDGSG
ncbi:hypothetical protein ACQKWADRAFT_325476 [Trichoderma austrokoningii]